MRMKVITGITLTLFLASLLCVVFDAVPVTAVPDIIRVPDDYERIQWAVGNASAGDTILVAAGTYYEHVTIDKTLTLIGENLGATIIDGGGTGLVVHVKADNVVINNFTIRNSGLDWPAGGIYLDGSAGNTIQNNNIANNRYGVRLDYSSNNTVSGNNIANNQYSVYLYYSSNNTLSDNNIANNDCGVSLYYSSNNNTLSGNTITANGGDGVYVYQSSNNKFSGNDIIANHYYGINFLEASNNKIYHNNFINNEIYELYAQAGSSKSINTWDDGYPSGGNYWGDYTGVDNYSGLYQNETGGDDIGDTPYVIDENNRDDYPLMNPWDKTPPVADAGPDQTVKVGMIVIFDGSGSYDNVGIKSYVWAFTDVTPKTLTGVHPTYTFNNIGDYEVTLNVTDYAGNWDTDTMWANVSAPPIINVPTDYLTIQEAIDAATPGDIVQVAAGTYYEHLTVNKMVSLIGEDKSNTIIDGGGTGTVVHVTANNVTISGFTIQNGGDSGIKLEAPFPLEQYGNNITENTIINNGVGIDLYDSHANTITGNTIINNWDGIGIDMSFSSGNIIAGNNITGNWPEGISMFESGGNTITGNTLTDNWDGVDMFHCSGNSVTGNNLANNVFGVDLHDSGGNNITENIITTNPVTKGIATYYGFCICLRDSDGNTIYHNNFIQNIQGYDPVSIHTSTSFWDDGYPSGGNCWSDYAGVDEFSSFDQDEPGSDGVGDTPYIIDDNNRDRYPLMTPWSPLPIKVFDVVWEDVHYPVATRSNSTITHFIFNQTLAQIGFNVSGSPDTVGYCNVSIPKNLLRNNPWTITIDGAPKTDFTQSTNDTHTFLYFNYTHASTRHIVIQGTWVVPEFPTWVSMLLILSMLSVAIAILRRKMQRPY